MVVPDRVEQAMAGPDKVVQAGSNPYMIEHTILGSHVSLLMEQKVTRK